MMRPCQLQSASSVGLIITNVVKMTPSCMSEQHMQMLCPSWKLDDGGHKISRTFNAKNFKGALAWLNEAGE